MLRLLAFFAAVWVLHRLLPQLPWVGPLFEVPLLGFWLAAALLALALSRGGALLVKRAGERAALAKLGEVDTPFQRGKLGSLLQTMGRNRAALPHLEAAIGAATERAEWHYRLGCALLQLGRARESIQSLERALAIDEGCGYGAARMKLARALAAEGDDTRSLAELERLERDHGGRPESAYRRGHCLRRLDRYDEAARAFETVGELVRGGAGYQSKGSSKWRVRAFLARLWPRR